MKTDLETVTNTINERVKGILEASLWNDGNALSEVIVELAAYAVFLTDYVAQAHLKELQDKDVLSREFTKAIRKHVETGMAVNRAEIEVKSMESIGNFQTMYRDSESEHYTLKLKRDSVNTLIDAIRSRVSSLRKDREL